MELKASSVRQLPELPARDAMDVLQKVHGFYQVKNEDDLRQCMEGLNALFNRALDLELDEEHKPAPRVKKAPRPASTSTPRSPRSAAYLDRAAEILAATDPHALSSLLESPGMRHALNVTGIRPEDLVPKTHADFVRERDRAWTVPPEIAAMRFKHYEKARKSSVALLLQVAESQEIPSSDDAKDFDRELDHERRLLEDMIRGRLRYEKVLEKEAEMIRRKRAKFLVQENGVFRRRGDEPPAFKDHVHAERSETNRLKMERVRAQRQLLEQTKQENADARRRYEQSRATQTKKEKDDQLKLKRVLGDERERKRLQVIEDARELDRQRRECIELAVHERRKRLAQHAREVTVQRAKKIQSFKTDEASKKLHATTERVDNLKEIRRAILQERNRIHVLTRSRKAHCKSLRDEIDVLPVHLFLIH
ncbi:hypothetical protein SPRG_07310 [Saprolegnia parasitica CBS 223.65]|uniref:Uncharacterized protein n=1 Tax=Saprolegnia parasitica (strain CBS 223.65) TaxID=695850 RepID=A0A067CMF4_SAPPC|nr:hypothetical protein SPRG_07310 [Saprolegnia parasitica CBS 223.65]KDO27681.1 hypothetical protein SPRG_07310 [Saprolegnia parasitica CBS 223.65]|eukprot:XP_012201492.1 hypothetical protein SPRG_07310 [Saprolegnia parasitica CBS 223.65]